jgi:signal transduction histidine kinase
MKRAMMIPCLLWLALARGQETLDRVSMIRDLDAGRREQHLPVRLDVVVTYYHPGWGVLFVHDGTDGICVGVSENKRPQAPYHPGMSLKVAGWVGPGEFLPVVLPGELEVGEERELPTFEPVNAEKLFTPIMDARPVEVAAVVKGTWFGEESLVVELEVEGRIIRAILPQTEPLRQLPWQLVEQRVRVRGVAGTHFNDQRQMSGRLLFVQSLTSFSLVDELKPPGPTPLVPVDGLLRVDSPLRQRVRVRGVTTHVAEGRGLYLRGEGGSMFVQTAQSLKLQTGDEVEAEGYPIVTPFRPSLSAVDVKKTGASAEPEPVEFHAAQTRHSREQCELVALSADLLEVNRDRAGTHLLCRAEGQTFEAALGRPLQSAEELLELLPGMKLRLTGICEFITDRPLVIPRNATSFRLMLRQADDIHVLAQAPWWTEQRARWLLVSLLALAAAVGGWAVTLQFMVNKQKSVIRQQAEQQATLEERQRIAQDLHDTLEQELVGVNMLLDDTARRINSGESPATQPLELARRLLRRAREDSRSTIRELRSVALEKRGLPAAIEELLRPLASAAGAEFIVAVNGTPMRLSGTLETNLLRLVQEAVANAAKHARATRIEVKLDYDEETIRLIVRDDGTGFDPAAMTALAGHFGLSGMRERAEKMAGRLRIHSAPGKGTEIEVHVPHLEFPTPLEA